MRRGVPAAGNPWAAPAIGGDDGVAMNTLGYAEC